MLRKLLPQLAKDPQIQAKLKEVPFTEEPPDPSKKREKPPVRKLVKSMLYCDEHIPPEELQYMRDHPEELEWLKSNVRPRLWRKFVDYANRFREPHIPKIEE